jgi:hypothetical protein
MEEKMRKKLGMLAMNVRMWTVNMRPDGNCEDCES